MSGRFLAVFAAATLVLAPTYSTSAQPSSAEDQQEERWTPCEKKAIEIAEHAGGYNRSADATTIPFQIADNVAKSCGVFARGIDTLVQMGCPSDVVQMIRDAHALARETLTALNDKYSFAFNCYAREID